MESKMQSSTIGILQTWDIGEFFYTEILKIDEQIERCLIEMDRRNVELKISQANLDELKSTKDRYGAYLSDARAFELKKLEKDIIEKETSILNLIGINYWSKTLYYKTQMEE